VPVTAKLSREFYEKFGDQIADELVNWFNQVDATYRADLKELNELNFARFDAKLEQRMAQLEAKLEQRMAQLEGRMAQLEAKLEQRLAEFRAEIEHRLSEQTRWLLGAWGILLAAVISLWFR
jgi:BMFP domain-containing protein YqiC